MTTKLTRARKALALDPSLVDRVLLIAEPEPMDTVRTPAQMYDLFAPLLVGLDHEALACVALDRRLRPIEVAVLTRGSLAYTVMDPCRILRWVLTRGRPAHGFALAHNHPSGNPDPSQEDIDVTRKVADAARVVRCRLFDHVVIAGDRCVSMAEQGDVDLGAMGRL